MIPSSSIHIVANGKISFFFIAKVYKYHNFFIHSSVNGNLGSFYILAIVDNAAMNIGVHVPLRISTFLSFGK